MSPPEHEPRFLLDANAVLNATFVAESWSRLAVQTALSAGASLFVGTATLQEARHVVSEYACSMRRRSDPGPFIEGFVRDVRAIEVGADDSMEVTAGVPGHDAHVYREATACRAEILTSDPELWLACRPTATRAIFPLELIRRFNGPALANTVFGVQPTRDAGMIFMRAYPGSWAHNPPDDWFTAIFFPGVFWLYYDGGPRGWRLESEGYQPMFIPCDVRPNELQTVAFYWRTGDRIVLRVAHAEHPVTLEMNAPLPEDVGPKVQIGGHPNGRHYWNGAIYVCVNDDRPLGHEAWRIIKRDREITPNPFDDDRLRHALSGPA